MVTNKQLSESRGQVVIGVEARDECEPLFPWEEGITTFAVGYRRELRFDLKNPLDGRQIIDKARAVRPAFREVPFCVAG
ncbi:hypothetical protein ACFWYW_52525 [Nonomuraea sp. NPDC059023]|uniref:hypothetical protein n=1 Tax=unclassified Nonomuraea TaxID=2593643 RepID=UPI0036962A00